MGWQQIHKFELCLVPVAKGRPRFSRRTGVAYTPTKTRNAEADLLVLLQDAVKGGAASERPIKMELDILLERPKSHTKKRRIFDGGWHITKPDQDNFVKLFQDAARSLIWKNDSQICKSNIEKRYIKDGQVPGYNVTLYEYIPDAE